MFDDPIGGRSLMEFALEARVRVGNFGIVPFIDAGNISTSPLPGLDGLQFGAGIGARYHTRFGPIRVDVGTPAQSAQRRSAHRRLCLAGPGLLMATRRSSSSRSAGKPERLAGRGSPSSSGLLLGLALALAALIAFLDTGAGHRFIVDRIAAMTPKSGLRIRIGRIDGSIWGRTTLRDVRLYDPNGLFAQSSEIEMDWRPLDFLWNSLVIHELESDLVILHRLPELNPPEEPRPLLPAYDVHLGRLDVRQLRIGARVTGRERIGSLTGQAEIGGGRALLGLDVAVRDGGDRIRIRLDAEPERDRFDLDARIRAPAGGVAGAMLGTRRPVRLDLGGEGSWSRWQGQALLDVSGRRTADLRLNMAGGRFRLEGWAAPAPFLSGKKQRLTAPRVNLRATGLFENRRVDGRLSAVSPAMRVEARGRVRSAPQSLRGRADRRRIAAAAGALPEHDRAADPHRRDAGGAGRDGALQLSADQPAHRFRQYRVRGGAAAGGGQSFARAGAGAGGAGCAAGDGRGRRRGRHPGGPARAGRRPGDGRAGLGRQSDPRHRGICAGWSMPRWTSGPASIRSC